MVNQVIVGRQVMRGGEEEAWLASSSCYVDEISQIEVFRKN